MPRLLNTVTRSQHRRRNILALSVSALTVSLLIGPLHAQRAETPIPQKAQVDWSAAARDAQSLSPLLSRAPQDKAFTRRHRSRVTRRLDRLTIKEGMAPLAHLNEVAVELFPGVATVPIPVLAPFETSRFLNEKARFKDGGARSRVNMRREFLHDAGSTLQIVPDATGYDAIVTYEPGALGRRGIASRKRRMVHIAGAAQSYGGAETGDLVADLQAEYPGLRRYLGEDEVGYSFRKYGVPYFAIASCSSGRTDPEALTCEQAEDLLRITVRNLRLLGGSPLPMKARASAKPPPPRRMSSKFQYFPPGKLLDNTGDDGKEGAPDRNVYANIRFPLKEAPSYGQSQVFMNGGNCLSTPGTTDHIVPLNPQPGDTRARYRCTQNQKQLLRWEGHPENYGQPWRDNFCEARRGTPGSTLECPAGRGHAGQDIRPKDCPGAATSAKCRPDTHPVVAVATGNACRDGNKIRLRLVGADQYYVYLHMNKRTMDAAGMQDQRCTAVAREQVIGKVGNFQDVEGGTTTHLHFEIHPVNALSRFNPYMTLVRAYEQLIGAQGTEISTTARRDE